MVLTGTPDQVLAPFKCMREQVLSHAFGAAEQISQVDSARDRVNASLEKDWVCSLHFNVYLFRFQVAIR